MDEILAWELVEWSLGYREVELAVCWRWSNGLLVNEVLDGMTGPLSSPWHCWSLLGPLRNLMMNKLGFLWIDPSTIGLDSCGPWSNDLGLLTAFWNKPFCQFWAQSYCMYLDSLVQWPVSFKLGPYFTKSHWWTIGFGALIQRGLKS